MGLPNSWVPGDEDVLLSGSLFFTQRNHIMVRCLSPTSCHRAATPRSSLRVGPVPLELEPFVFVQLLPALRQFRWHFLRVEGAFCAWATCQSIASFPQRFPGPAPLQCLHTTFGILTTYIGHAVIPVAFVPSYMRMCLDMGSLVAWRWSLLSLQLDGFVVIFSNLIKTRT